MGCRGASSFTIQSKQAISSFVRWSLVVRSCAHLDVTDVVYENCWRATEVCGVVPRRPQWNECSFPAASAARFFRAVEFGSPRCALGHAVSGPQEESLKTVQKVDCAGSQDQIVGEQI